MGLPIQIRIIYNLNYCHAICVKFGDTCLISSTKLVFEAEASIIEFIIIVYYLL